MSIQSRSHQYGTVFENWQILELLGQGSGGKTAVFRLKRIDSNRGQSALKVVNLIEERGDCDTMPAHLKKEYEAARDECKASALQEVWMMDDFQGNTNIVDYLDHKFVDWTDESGFGCDMLIRMELLKDLRGEIRSGKAFSEADIVKVGCDICQALILCHGNGILHRDIKPENIFVNRNGNYKLGDFGISRIISNAPMSMASTGIGTPEYAAPEQTSGKYDKRVDIYSLGLVLYELSNQFHLPFAKSSYVRPDDVNMRMTGVPLPPPSGASKELCAIILRACAFKAEDRYQTAQEFANALIAFAKQTSGCSSAHPIITNDVSDTARPVQGGSYSTEPAISSSYNKVPAHVPTGYETMPAVEIEQEIKRDQYQTVPAGSNDLSVAQKAAPAEKKTESEPSFAELLEQSIKTIAVGDKVNGIVTFIDDNNIHVDLGTKHVGYLPLDEFSSDPLSDPRSDVKIGDEIEVFVLRVNDREGTVLLSKKKLDKQNSWAEIISSAEEKRVIEGVVTEANNGGLIVEVKGIRVFIPVSQTDIKKDEMSVALGRKVPVVVTEVNTEKRRAIGSMSVASQIIQKKLWSEIQVGAKYRGVVKSLTSYGAFVDIGGIVGMVHVSELSWTKIKQPSDIVNVGDELDVYVISTNPEKGTISLGHKSLKQDPWTSFLDRYSIGDIVEAKVVKVMSFGVFAEIIQGVDGLIYSSELSKHGINSPTESIHAGEPLHVKIDSIDSDIKRVILSIVDITEQDEQSPNQETSSDLTEKVELLKGKPLVGSVVLDSKNTIHVRVEDVGTIVVDKTEENAHTYFLGKSIKLCVTGVSLSGRYMVGQMLENLSKEATSAKPVKENKASSHIATETPKPEQKNSAVVNGEDIKRLIRTAGKDGTGKSQYLLGKMFSEGEKCVQNYEEAYKWFNSSAAWHYGPGLTALGDCFFYGRGVQKDREKGLKYYAKAYEHSDSEGAYRLACWYEGIQSNAQNLNKAAQYFEKAAEWGCVPACYKIGKCYELGRGVKYDLHRAFNWYMRGADQNYIPAIMQVASYYQTGKYVPEDRKKWQEWVERAAKLGDSSAQYKLAEHYEHEGSIYLAEVLDKPDREIEPALAEAIRLYKQSAAQGYSMAKNGLESLRKSLQSEAEKGNNSRYSVMALRLLKLF